VGGGVVRPAGQAPGPVFLWKVSRRRWFMKPEVLCTRSFRCGGCGERGDHREFVVLLGPVQLQHDAWGTRLHVTWPGIHTVTLVGVRANCGRSAYWDEAA